jgi:predicted dehydrogenase
MSKQVRVGIVGLGKVAHLHARALQTSPDAALTAVCSRSPERASAFGEQYGAAAFTDVGAMIDAARIDLLIVCTPHPAHVEPAVAAASRGVHVLVEKPLASSLADCDAMINAARASGAKLGVVSQRRFYEPVVRVRQAIDAGKIGRPVLASTVMYGWRDEAYYRSDPWRGQWLAEGGGVLVNQAPHQLDLFQWLMGPIDELFGYWGNLNHPTIEVEDTAVAVVRFKNGGMGTIMVSNSQKPGIYAKVHIHGDSGATVGVQPEGGAMFIAGMTSILEPPLNDLWTVPGEESLLAGWQQADREAFAQVDPTTHYIGLQLHDFVRAIIEDRAPAVTGDDGRVTVELFTAIYRSQRDGRPVKFPVRAADTADDFDGRLTAR